MGTTDFDKSLGYSLLLVGFPTLLAVVPALLVTLCLNLAAWGAALGAGLGLAARVPWNRREP